MINIFQIIPDLMLLSYFNDQSVLFKALRDLYSLTTNEFKLKLIAYENFNYVDLIKAGTTIKDKFKLQNTYLWNLINKRWITKKFPYNWVDRYGKKCC